MRILLMLLMAIPVSLFGQMMPERLALRDTAALRAAEGVTNTDTTVKFPASSVTNMPETAVKQLPSGKNISPMSSFEFWLSIIILAFTLIIILTEVWLFRSGVLHLTTDAASRIVLVTLIIGGTMFLIAAGYSNDQIAPAVGLFGTIAGYLLGRSVSGTPDKP